MHLDDLQQGRARVFEPMFGADGDISGFILVQCEHLIAACHPGRSLHDHPVLRPVMMQLQRKNRARVYRKSLDLESLACVQTLVRPPRPKHPAMKLVLAALIGLEAIHDLFDILRAVFARHEDGVRRFNHGNIIDTHRGQQAMLRNEQRVTRIVCVDVTHYDITAAVLVRRLPQRRPRTYIRPPCVQRDDRCSVGSLHNRIVDGIAGTGIEFLAIHIEKVAILTAFAVGGRAGPRHFRLPALELFQPRRCKHHEYAAVPEIVSRSKVFLGGRQVRLFYKSANLMTLTALDITVSGFRCARSNPECHERPLLRNGNRFLHGGPEGRDVADIVIRGHSEQQRIFILAPGIVRRQGQRRGRVAPNGFKEDIHRRLADLAHLFGNEKPVLVVTHDQRISDPRDAVQPRGGLLQQGFLAGKRQQLLRVVLARHRPQPCSGSAR